jgi:hypothetical protein
MYEDLARRCLDGMFGRCAFVSLLEDWTGGPINAMSDFAPPWARPKYWNNRSSRSEQKHAHRKA